MIKFQGNALKCLSILLSFCILFFFISFDIWANQAMLLLFRHFQTMELQSIERKIRIKAFLLKCYFLEFAEQWKVEPQFCIIFQTEWYFLRAYMELSEVEDFFWIAHKSSPKHTNLVFSTSTKVIPPPYYFQNYCLDFYEIFGVKSCVYYD